MEPVEITAGRLHLRPWQAGDEPVLLELGSGAGVQRWPSLPVPCLPDDARAYVRDAAPRGWSSGEQLTWAVCDSTTSAVLASVGLRPERDAGLWTTGFWCRPSARGQGVTSQAVATVCRWAFAELGAVRIECTAAVGDWASRRTAEKAGFRVEGVRRGGVLRGGAGVDGWLAGRLRGDDGRDTRALPPLGRPSDGVVALRHWRVDDLPAVARGGGDPVSARWLPLPVPYTEADARAWALGVVPRDWAEGTGATVAVVDAATDEPLGAVGLTFGRARTAEIGYWTAPTARGRGVAVRGARLHTAWGVAALGLARVELLTAVHNHSSQSVAQRAGFVREGIARGARPAPRSDDRVDMVVWSHVPGRDEQLLGSAGPADGSGAAAGGSPAGVRGEVR